MVGRSVSLVARDLTKNAQARLRNDPAVPRDLAPGEKAMCTVFALTHVLCTRKPEQSTPEVRFRQSLKINFQWQSSCKLFGLNCRLVKQLHGRLRP